MSQLRCLLCNRAIRNMNTAKQVDGGWLGPSCFRRAGMPTKAKKYEDTLLSQRDYNRLHRVYKVEKTAFVRGPDGRNTYDELGLKTSPSRSSYDGAYDNAIHHEVFDEFSDQIDSAQVINTFENDQKNRSGKKLEKSFLVEIDEVQRAKVKFVFLNFFRNLSSTKAEVAEFKKMGIRVFAIVNHEDTRDSIKEHTSPVTGVSGIGQDITTSFIISADNSPYPERLLQITINNGSRYQYTPILLKNNKMIFGRQGEKHSFLGHSSYRSPTLMFHFGYVKAYFTRENPLTSRDFRMQMKTWFDYGQECIRKKDVFWSFKTTFAEKKFESSDWTLNQGVVQGFIDNYNDPNFNDFIVKE